MTLKPGVRIAGVQPEAVLGMQIAEGVFREFGGFGNAKGAFVLTSVCEGKHGTSSLHYKGMAFDIRTRALNQAEQNAICARLRAALGADFDVVLETDHIHVEFDPKTPVSRP